MKRVPMMMVTAMLAFSTVAAAQDATPAATPAATAAPKVKVERSASGQKIFRITEGIVVEGKIQKPNAFYVLQRSSMDYDWESLKQDFLPKVIQAASKHPF
jgi:uncharacterized protein (DUF2147 family)